MCGNEAMAEAAVLAGLDAYFGYPITPQNEVTAYMSRRMRGGPGLGNIAPAQGDYFQATRGGGHGDYRTIALGPSSVQELADCMPLAFDLADQYRMTVTVLADGILGQMMEPVILEAKPRRKLPPKDWALTGADGREQNIVRSLWLKEGALEEHNYKLQEKYRQVERNEVLCEEHEIDDAEIVVVAYGVAARIVRSAVARARDDGLKAGWIRPITLWPFPYDKISKAADELKIFLVVELSCGQMVEDVKLSVAGKAPVLLYGRPGGGVPTIEQVFENIKQLTIPKQSEKLKVQNAKPKLKIQN